MELEWKSIEETCHELYANGERVASIERIARDCGEWVVYSFINDKGLGLKGLYDGWVAPAKQLCDEELSKLKKLVESMLVEKEDIVRPDTVSKERIRFSLEASLDSYGLKEVSDEDVERVSSIIHESNDKFSSFQDAINHVLSDIRRTLDEEIEHEV